MNTIQPLSVGQSTEAHLEQPASSPEVEHGPTTTFFAVGIVINIVLVTAYFFWAYKQWNKTGRKRKE